MMSGFSETNFSKDANTLKLINDLCTMTGCDHEQAAVYLSNYNYDLETAANKILEKLSNAKLEDGWQTVNRHKKPKTKTDKLENEWNGDNFVVSNSLSDFQKKFTSKVPPDNSVSFKSSHQKSSGLFKSGTRNRTNRTFDYQNIEKANERKKYNSFDHYSDNEMRWDNTADVADIRKYSDNSSIDVRSDGFASEDDLVASHNTDDHSYHGISTQLTDSISTSYQDSYNKSDYIAPENVLKQNQECNIAHKSEMELVNDCLTHLLPVFGKFCKTRAPKSLSKVPEKPVSFICPMNISKAKNNWHFNFGVNMTEALTITKLSNPKYQSASFATQILNTSEPSILFSTNNHLLPSNNSTYSNQSKMHLMSLVQQQQKKVAALLLSQHPSAAHYPMNVIHMPNSGIMDPGFPLHPENMPPHVDPGYCSQNQENYLQPYSSFNISVPYHTSLK